jgi:plastocyanin
LSEKKSSVSATTALAVAVVALIVGLAAVAIPLIAPAAPSTPAASSEQLTALQGQVNQLQSQVNSLPVVNEKPITRAILVQWTLLASAQDRFNPGLIVINQGDTVNLTFESNDTGDAHTFTVLLPTGLFQLNLSEAGLNNFLTQQLNTGPATDCMLNGNSVPCNTTGTIGNLSATGMFTVTKPGIYRYFCFYHQSLGMYGWLVVLPNKGYTGGS